MYVLHLPYGWDACGFVLYYNTCTEMDYISKIKSTSKEAEDHGCLPGVAFRLLHDIHAQCSSVNINADSYSSFSISLTRVTIYPITLVTQLTHKYIKHTVYLFFMS